VLVEAHTPASGGVARPAAATASDVAAALVPPDGDAGGEGGLRTGADAPAAAGAGGGADAGADGGEPRQGELPLGALYEVSESAPVTVVALARPTWVYEGPEHSTRRLGYVHPGMRLARAEQPVAFTRRCRGGWYRVAPRGYLCMGAEVTTDLTNPVAVALETQAQRGQPLPYRYGRGRGYPPFLYARVPTPREQRMAEGEELDEHLAKVPKFAQLPQAGQIDPLPAWLEGGKVLPKPINVHHRGRIGPHRGQAGPKSSFAFVSVYDVAGRLFGLTTELDLVALDRVKLATASRIHGGTVADLPAALVQRAAVPRYSRDERGAVAAAGAFEAFEALSLTGKTGGGLLEAEGGVWLGPGGATMFKRRSSFPGWVVAKEGDAAPMKWVDISIREQSLVAYEGRRAVFVARVSTGAGFDGDPETTTATVRGYFKIQNKHVTATMTGAQSEEDYELLDVPYVQYFQGGYALHAAFWHEDFGRPRSHGCVNLSPRDAAWLFEWTEPHVPAEWHGMEANGGGTLVYIH
jgi:lipoprotein-anchoring transpeptidase ErfK/SrfK